jgi:SpoVK/Ycf46/Vps4 family AAA+-type ATPase
MDPSSFLTELFRIVEGALRQDGVKVRNYADLLAQKLEASGEPSSAKRLRRLLQEQGQMLHPARVGQNSTPPVDSESRFPLVEQVNPGPEVDRFIFAGDQQPQLDDFLAAIRHRGVLENSGVSAATTLLLYGPPGCGKSHLAAYVARAIGLPLYIARLDGLISSFLGSTAKNIRAVFEFAARTPCVLFLDEFDAIAKLRDDQQEVGELKRVVNSFIQALDAHAKELVLVAATNHEQLLDTAIWRRFSFLIHMGLPPKEQRTLLWRMHSQQFDWGERRIQVLADLSDGCSCSAIVSACARLRQRQLAQNVAPTLHAALALLFSQRDAAGRNPMPFDLASLSDPKVLYRQLHARNASLYSPSVVGELADVSKATMYRKLSALPSKPREVTHARRTAVH